MRPESGWLFECSLYRGNISTLPCFTQERQRVSLDLKPRSLSDVLRRFSSFPYILQLSSLRCLNISATYASFAHHCASPSNSACAEFSANRNTLSSSLNLYSRAKTFPHESQQTVVCSNKLRFLAPISSHRRENRRVFNSSGQINNVHCPVMYI